MAAIPAGGDLARRDHARFTSEIEDLIRQAEDLRLSHMKRHRAQSHRALGLGLVLLIAGAGGFGWFLLVEADIVRALGAIALAIILPLYFNLRPYDTLRAYREEYKTRFLPRLAQAMGGFTFHPARGISAKIVQRSGVAPAFDHYVSEDCFMGRYRGVKVIFSEARLSSAKNKDKGPEFSGLFVLLEAPGDIFEGHTVITAHAENAHKWRAGRWAKLQEVNVSTGDAALDRFHVFSDTPEAARAAVTPALLRELAEAAALFERAPLSAAMFGKKFLFLAIPYARDMFEPSSIHVPVATRQHALQCKREVEQIFSIIDVFDLFRPAGGQSPT